MKKVSLKRASVEGAKETAAIALITIGMGLIQQGEYPTGMMMVALGFIMIVVDKLIV